MPDPDLDLTPANPTPAPEEGVELAEALIAQKEGGADVDAAILALLDDYERLGLTGSEAYVMLDAYRPGAASGAPPEAVENLDGPTAPDV